jgi:hypothetical protein
MSILKFAGFKKVGSMAVHEETLKIERVYQNDALSMDLLRHFSL